jgi:hypothetical protein
MFKIGAPGVKQNSMNASIRIIKSSYQQSSAIQLHHLHNIGIHWYARFMIFFILTMNHAYSAEFDAEVLQYSTRCEISQDKMQRTDSIVILINNRSGEIYTSIEIKYSKDNPVNELSAWIEDRSGKIIRHLKKQEIIEASAITNISFYEDTYVKRFVLKHNEYPYRIGYTYKTSFRQFLSIANWYPIVALDVPTRKASLTVIVPEQYPIRIHENRIAKGQIRQASGVVRHEWSATYDGLFRSEPYCPDLSTLLTRVEVVPLRFFYGTEGSMRDWKSFGNWQYRLNQGLDELPEAEKQKVSAMISGIREKREVIRTLYHYMQDNTRYINISMDIGGMKPYPAAYVSQNRYGDCKALTNYMKALLKVAGIESFYTLVYANAQPKPVIRDFPSQQFNHAVLTIPLEQDTIWLENTSNTNPFGYAGTFIQNREALLIDDQSSRLIRIPALQPLEVQQIRRFDVLLRQNISSGLSLRFTLKGHGFDRFLALSTEYNQEEQQQIARRFMLPFPDYELNSLKISHPGRDYRMINLRADLSVKSMLSNIGREYYFTVVPCEMPDFEEKKARSLPVYLAYPVFSTDTIAYHLPFATGQVKTPENMTIESKYGKYTITYRREGDTLTVLREYCLYAGYYPPDEYPAINAFISAIKCEEKRKIIIQ